MITTIPQLNEFLAAKATRLDAEKRDMDHSEGLMLNAQFDQLAAAQKLEEETAIVVVVETAYVETPQDELAVEIELAVEMVAIAKTEYEWMLSRIDWLDCLEQAGVDNWNGFDYAIELRDQGQD